MPIILVAESGWSYVAKVWKVAALGHLDLEEQAVALSFPRSVMGRGAMKRQVRAVVLMTGPRTSKSRRDSLHHSCRVPG